MRGCYHGVHGLDTLFGNAIFKRDAQDQDYLDSLEINIDQTESVRLRSLKKFGFWVWEQIDFGRSLARPAIWASLIAIVFGLIFMLDMQFQWGLIDFSGSAQSFLTPFYFSVVTFTTLGYGDVLPIHWFGELLVIVEVVLGYSTLGLLLSILANKVARRS
jgi:voltage-gated potassium channel Kch